MREIISNQDEGVYVMELNAADIVPGIKSTTEKLTILLGEAPDYETDKSVALAKAKIILKKIFDLIDSDPTAPKAQLREYSKLIQYTVYYLCLATPLVGMTKEKENQILMAAGLYGVGYYIYDDIVDGGILEEEIFKDFSDKSKNITKFVSILIDILAGNLGESDIELENIIFPNKEVLLWLNLKAYKYFSEVFPDFNVRNKDFLTEQQIAWESSASTAWEIFQTKTSNSCLVPSYETHRYDRYYSCGGPAYCSLIGLMNGFELKREYYDLNRFMRAGCLAVATFNDVMSLKKDLSEQSRDNWIIHFHNTEYANDSKKQDLDAGDYLPSVRAAFGYINRQMMEFHRISEVVLSRFPEQRVAMECIKKFISVSFFPHVDSKRYGKTKYDVKRFKEYPTRDGQFNHV